MRLHRLATALVAILCMGVLAFGQEQKTVRIDSDGDFHLDRKMEIGDNLVGRGMYHVSWRSINGRVVFVFNVLSMSSGAKHFWSSRLGKEVARFACDQQSTGILNERSGLLIRKTGEDRWVMSALWFRNENYICRGPE